MSGHYVCKGCYARTFGQYERKMSDVQQLFQALSCIYHNKKNIIMLIVAKLALEQSRKLTLCLIIDLKQFPNNIDHAENKQVTITILL